MKSHHHRWCVCVAVVSSMVFFLYALLLCIDYYYPHEVVSATPKVAFVDTRDYDDSNVISITPPPPPPTTTIPSLLIFTYEFNMLTRNPENPCTGTCVFRKTLRSNVYRTMWLHSELTPWFLDDAECIEIINFINVEKEVLSKAFREERNGAYKGDICRGAMLYWYGGYYFDVDIYPIRSLQTYAPGKTFMSCISQGDDIFQAFVAAIPRHPVIKNYLRVMAAIYSGNLKPQGHMGTFAMKRAIEQTIGEKVVSFHSHKLPDDYLLFVEKRLPVPGVIAESQKGYGDPNVCDFIVYDKSSKDLVFYSRVKDSSNYCRSVPQRITDT